MGGSVGGGKGSSGSGDSGKGGFTPGFGTSSGGGKGAINAITNPVGYFTPELQFLDPFGAAGSAAVQNTWDVATGETTFGDHDNWFGQGPTGELLNTLVTGQRSDEAMANRELWNDYYNSTGIYAPKQTTVQTQPELTQDVPMEVRQTQRQEDARRAATPRLSLLSDDEWEGF